MKAEAYLEARGWPAVDTDDDGNVVTWVDSTMPSVVPASGGGNLKVTVSTSDALIIQRARDEEREAAAWVQFAATFAGIVTTDGDGNTVPMYEREFAAKLADWMLGEYRKRFAVEVES